MKSIFISFSLLVVLALQGCGKTTSSGCVPASVASEKTVMVDYCVANGISYTEHPSGILYQIMSLGVDPSPTANSTVSAVYTGKLLNGVVFDAAANPISFPLNAVIDGWKIGIPLIKKGGRIKLVIPSSLAYSCTGYPPTIPANSPLYFDVTLFDVK